MSEGSESATQTRPAPTQDNVERYASRDGALRRLIDTMDWSASPLGSPDAWPDSLKAAVELMLPAMAQIVLFWGPDYCALYNDAYAPSIGDKHPRALGRPARENWAELWDDLEPLLRTVRETGETIFAEDRPFYIERHGFPETVYFDISYSPVADGSGGVGGVLCIVSETTKRVRGETLVRESEARFHAMADSVEQMIWSTLPDGYHDYYNRRWYEYTGVPDGSTDGEAWNGMFHPEDQERAWAVWRHSLETGEPYHIEYRLRHRSGAYRWVLGRAQPVRDDKGAITRWYGTCTDIDDLKRAEDALRESEARVREVFQNAGVGMLEIDSDWNILSSNTAYCRITGRADTDLRGANCLSFTHPDDVDKGAQALQALAAGTTDQISFEKRYLRPDGSAIWVRSNLSRVSGAEGQSRFLKVIEDITAVREAREALRLSEERYRTLFESIDEGFCVIEFLDGPHGPLSDYVHVSANPAYEQHAGIADVVGQKVREMVPDEAESWVRLYREVLLTGEPIRFEQELVATGRHLELAAFRVEPAERRQVAVLFQDITARKQAAAALRETEERYRLATRATNDAIWDWDLVGNHVRWNEALCDAYGYTPADIREDGEWWIEHIHPDDRARIDASIHAVIDGGGTNWNDEYRFRRADGSYAEVLDRGTVIRDAEGKAVRMIGAMLDMTALRAAESAVREGEDRLRLAADATRIGIWDFDPRTGRLDWDARTKEVFGLQPDAEVDYSIFLAGLHPEDRDATDTAVQLALQPDGPGGYDVEYRVVTSDGTERWVAAKGTSIIADGEAVRFIGTVIDITDRKRNEAALARSERALRQLNATLEQRVDQALAERRLLADLVEGTDAFVQVVGADWRWLAINKASADEFERIFGIRPKVGDDMRELLASQPEHREAIEAVWTRALAGEEFTQIGEFGDPERDRRFYEMKFNGLYDEAGQRMGAYQFVYDVTERLHDQQRLAQAEEALRQAQKMEAVGQLTGGIAHDFNNLLTIITGNVDAARRHLGDAAEARIQRALGNAMIGAERAAVLTQRLLAFSRRQPLDPKPIDVNRLVGGMAQILHSTLGETIAVETVGAAGLWRIEADPNQLENAIINLAVNARDAMDVESGGGGKLTIETANTHLDRDYAAQNAGVTPGQYVVVCISDTGAGMDEETLERAFEPFFTTKDVGKGTGLGLSMVYGFVKQSGGHLKIYSEPGEGTTVRIYLPRFIGGEVEEQVPAAEVAPEGSRDETILVCEDDDDVRAYTVEVLRELGYRVLEAHDGPSALRLLERQDGKVDLLFTDVVLPAGMTGAILAEQVRTMRPDIKVLFTTGYARNAIVHHGRLDPGVELITKPFSYADLAARVRDMLDRN